jgi:hypothetical protein
MPDGYLCDNICELLTDLGSRSARFTRASQWIHCLDR